MWRVLSLQTDSSGFDNEEPLKVNKRKEGV